MLVILFFLIFFQILMNFFTHSCFIRFDLARNEDVYDVELEANDNNKYDDPQNSMLTILFFL